MKIYLASSWKNTDQPDLVKALRNAGHDVYDFRNPTPDDAGFHWEEIDPGYEEWSGRDYFLALDHPKANRGYGLDMDAMLWADCFVLLLPSGRSAHLEAGWAVGRGKPTCILFAEGEVPELMYKMAYLALDVEDVLGWLDMLDRDAK